VEQGRAAYRRWPVLELPLELLRRWIRVNASVLAGHLAFRVFLFMVPLVLVLVAVLGYASSSGVDVEEQGENLRMGQALAGVLADAGDDAESSHLQVGFVGLIALLSSASGLVAALRLVVAAVWDVPVKSAPTSKLKTMAWLVPGVGFILLGAAARQWLTRRGLVMDGLGALVAVTVNSATLLGLFWILPRRATRIVDLVPGAVAAAAGFAALNIAGAVYFTGKLQQSSEVYGALGVAITVLLYLFFVGQIVVLATLVNTIWLDRAEILERVRTGGDAPTAAA
jgi:membrane protein